MHLEATHYTPFDFMRSLKLVAEGKPPLATSFKNELVDLVLSYYESQVRMRPFHETRLGILIHENMRACLTKFRISARHKNRMGSILRAGFNEYSVMSRWWYAPTTRYSKYKMVIRDSARELVRSGVIKNILDRIVLGSVEVCFLRKQLECLIDDYALGNSARHPTICGAMPVAVSTTVFSELGSAAIFDVYKTEYYSGSFHINSLVLPAGARTNKVSVAHPASALMHLPYQEINRIYPQFIEDTTILYLFDIARTVFGGDTQEEVLIKLYDWVVPAMDRYKRWGAPLSGDLREWFNRETDAFIGIGR